MTPDLKRKIEEMATAYRDEAFENNPNGYSVFPGCNEPDTDFLVGAEAMCKLMEEQGKTCPACGEEFEAGDLRKMHQSQVNRIEELEDLVDEVIELKSRIQALEAREKRLIQFIEDRKIERCRCIDIGCGVTAGPLSCADCLETDNFLAETERET